MLCQANSFCLGVSWLCIATAFSLKWSANLCCVCGVRAISGINISTCFFAFRLSSTVCMYISVLPDPVIPCNRQTVLGVFFIVLSADFCSRLSACLNFSSIDVSSSGPVTVNFFFFVMDDGRKSLRVLDKGAK